MKRLLIALGLLPVLAAFTFFALAVWNVGGYQGEWIGSAFLAMFASVPGVAFLAAEADL